MQKGQGTQLRGCSPCVQLCREQEGRRGLVWVPPKTAKP